MIERLVLVRDEKSSSFILNIYESRESQKPKYRLYFPYKGLEENTNNPLNTSWQDRIPDTIKQKLKTVSEAHHCQLEISLV